MEAFVGALCGPGNAGGFSRPAKATAESRKKLLKKINHYFYVIIRQSDEVESQNHDP
jgi:hypothetical protein